MQCFFSCFPATRCLLSSLCGECVFVGSGWGTHGLCSRHGGWIVFCNESRPLTPLPRKKREIATQTSKTTRHIMTQTSNSVLETMKRHPNTPTLHHLPTERWVRRFHSRPGDLPAIPLEREAAGESSLFVQCIGVTKEDAHPAHVLRKAMSTCWLHDLALGRGVGVLLYRVLCCGIWHSKHVSPSSNVTRAFLHIGTWPVCLRTRGLAKKQWMSEEKKRKNTLCNVRPRNVWHCSGDREELAMQDLHLATAPKGGSPSPPTQGATPKCGSPSRQLKRRG